jgi:hypothetical protein
MNNRPILLFKDNSLSQYSNLSKKKLVKNKDNIKYLLIPIIGNDNLYIMHKFKDYMTEFTHAHISFTSVVIRHSHINEDGDTVYKILSSVDKEIYTIEEFLQYLHSLNRMKYINKLSDSIESYEFDIVEFIDFNLTIYKKDDILHEYHFNDHLGPVDILNRLKRIFRPINIKDKYLYLNFYDDVWKFDSKLKINNSLIGIPLYSTSSYQILVGDMVDILQSIIKDIYCSSVIYNPEVDEIDEETEIAHVDCISEFLFNFGSIRFHDIWVHCINDYLEYITYLPNIYTNLLSYAELIDLDDIKNVYKMKSTMTISTYGDTSRKEYELTFSNDKILSLNVFLKNIYNIYRGLL